jgi:hypothetical protein
MGKPQVSRSMARLMGPSARFAAVLAAVVGIGLLLGACSKCDVPNWFPNRPGQNPQSCHDAPAPQ